MITKYAIHNFKNHAETNLELSRLNILTGINGAGKSSVMQSMLLLRDSFYRRPRMETLFLDGESVNVGTSNELMNSNQEGGQDYLCLKMTSDTCDVEFKYKYPIADDTELSAYEGFEEKDPDHLKVISLFSDNFQYLSAFRTGPQRRYTSSSIVEKHRQISQKMGQGEYAASYLSNFGGEDISIAQLQYPGTESKSLYAQAEKWMGEISRGIKFQINQKGNKDVELNFGYEREGRSTVYHNAMNTGFGVSYVLSLVVAVLSAKPGSLILIENPEAHIHPSGQSALMRMIGIAAANGVQCIIETHSDHIVNGALVAGKERLGRDKLSVYYFCLDESLNCSPVKLEIEPGGRIINAPAGFCDQMEEDMDILFGDNPESEENE